MKPIPIVDCWILDTGYCLASEDHVIQGGRRRTIHCHALVALLHHPKHGWLLWDTGYAPRMLSETRRWPYMFYRLATPLYIRPEQALVTQLGQLGITPTDVSTIIISHFHADHIAGLRDFPQAHFLASHTGFADIASRRGFRALRRGYIPALLPDDFVQRASWVEAFNGPSLPGLGPSHDVYEDGSLQLMPLPGHARGQLGLLANTNHGRLLFAADGAWLTRSIRECKPPSPITNFLVDQPYAVLMTINRLNIFWRAEPDVRILPTHCPETYDWGQRYAAPQPLDHH